MADYQLTKSDMVLRVADQVYIPQDPHNHDRQKYDQWLADGGVPDPYVPPLFDPAPPAPEGVVLYDHENRLRAIEGQPPLSYVDFTELMQRGSDANA